MEIILCDFADFFIGNLVLFERFNDDFDSVLAS